MGKKKENKIYIEKSSHFFGFMGEKMNNKDEHV